jgi:hypothetical protein
MMGILIFTIALILLGIIFRYAGAAYYDKVYGVPKADLTVDENNTNEELIAVISAAIADDLHGGIVIRKISLLSQANDSAWKRTGKLTIMSSHTVQHKH